MSFRRIELYGFKSFADKTKIDKYEKDDFAQSKVTALFMNKEKIVKEIGQ